MAKDVYSAGLMSQSFWFHEFKKAVKLMKDGLSFDEIKKKCVEENLFGAAKEYRALRMAGYIVNRLKVMDDTMVDLFLTSDLATQKLINLITILKQDLLFFEFIYEVYREKVILGSETLDDMDVKSFFTKKESQSELILGWKESTKNHLRSSYTGFMADANLLSVVDREKRITPPVLDIALERYLIATGDDTMVRALTGVN
ncbi:DUF1819 family protein [Anaerotignum sp.]|nr:DUF1819 family protein [Anaerotignum sp.]MBQ7759004.1 DUF1819 family protein [Anaerotignum sp.]